MKPAHMAMEKIWMVSDVIRIQLLSESTYQRGQDQPILPTQNINDHAPSIEPEANKDGSDDGGEHGAHDNVDLV